MISTAATSRTRASRRAVVLLVVLLASLAVAILVGSVTVPVDEVLRVLQGQPTTDPRWAVIIGDVRLPRVVTSVLAGAALGAAGLLMQTLFRNALADPYVLGASAGASLGVALVILGSGGVVLGAGFGGGLTTSGRWGTVIAATAGSALVLGAVLALAGWVRSAVTLLLVGVMAGAVTSSLVSVLVVYASPQSVQQFLVWGMGSFAGTTWADLRIAAPVVGVGLLLAALTVRSANALLLGEAYARSMGISLGRSRAAILLAAALLTSVVTAFCGPIGFLGLVVPHLARSLFGTSNHRVVLPASVAVGAVVGVWCGIAADLPGTSLSLPLSAVTALVGAPVAVVMLLRGRASTGGEV